MASPVEAVDQRSGRLIIWFVGLIGLIGMITLGLLIAIALQKPADQVAAYMVAVGTVGTLVGVLIGGLVNALTLRSGGSVDDLNKLNDTINKAIADAIAAAPAAPTPAPAPVLSDPAPVHIVPPEEPQTVAVPQTIPVAEDPLLDELGEQTPTPNTPPLAS